MPVTIRGLDQPQENMCTGCAGYCCSLRVDLTPYDIFRILAFEGKSIQDFIEFFEAKEDDALGIRASGNLVKFVLKHKGGSCVFFDKHSELKCSIEASKPAICITYPFSLAENKARPVYISLCPLENRKIADRHEMPIKVLQEMKWELARSLEMVEDWNSTAKGDEHPLHFLRFAAREIELEKSIIGSAYRKVLRRFARVFRKRIP